MKNNLWILGEEALRPEAIKILIQDFADGERLSIRQGKLSFFPEHKAGKFTHRYIIKGVEVEGVEECFYKVVSGEYSFLDYLPYHQISMPTQQDKPMMLAEDNKSSPSDSGNMIMQRAIKFAIAMEYYGTNNCLYLNSIPKFKNMTPAYRRGCRVLNTMGVRVKLVDFEGNSHEPEVNPYKNIPEVEADFPWTEPGTKKTPYCVKVEGGIAYIQARIQKGKKPTNISDPSVGFIGGMIKVLRVLGFEGEIRVVNHRMSDNWLVKPRSSKLAKICDCLGPVTFANSASYFVSLKYVNKKDNDNYWKEATHIEKHGTIYLDVHFQNQEDWLKIYDNHASTERGWFVTPDGEHIQVPKNIGGIPDLVVKNEDTKEILVFEGEMYKNAEKGVEQFQTFKGFKALLQEHYPDYDIKFHLVLNGGSPTEENVYFHLTESGEPIFNKRCKGYDV